MAPGASNHIPNNYAKIIIEITIVPQTKRRDVLPCNTTLRIPHYYKVKILFKPKSRAYSNFWA